MAAGRWVGRGDKEGGDGAAVDAMRRLVASVSIARNRRDRRGRKRTKHRCSTTAKRLETASVPIATSPSIPSTAPP